MKQYTKRMVIEMYKKLKRYLKKNKYLTKIVYFFKLPYKRNKLQNNGLKILNELGECLSKINVDYFADFGTLLGIIREEGIIKHDLDMDIGIFYNGEEQQRKIYNCLVQSHFIRSEYFVYNGKIVEESYMKKQVKIDIFYYEKNKDRCFCYFSYNPDKKNEKFCVGILNYTLINQLINRKVKNYNIKIPSNYEDVLTEKYGNNWRVPDATWNHVNSDNFKILNGHTEHRIG